jgi:hypothetical protein
MSFDSCRVDIQIVERSSGSPGIFFSEKGTGNRRLEPAD